MLEDLLPVLQVIELSTVDVTGHGIPSISTETAALSFPNPVPEIVRTVPPN